MVKEVSKTVVFEGRWKGEMF